MRVFHCTALTSKKLQSECSAMEVAPFSSTYRDEAAQAPAMRCRTMHGGIEYHDASS